MALLHGFSFSRQDFFDGRSLVQLGHPLRVGRVFLLDVVLDAFGLKHRRHGTPRDEGEVGDGALVTHQIGFAGAFEVAVEHAADAADFLDIAVLGRRQLFGVKANEPGGLAEVGALTRHLEHKPLVLDVLVRRIFVAEFAFLVVGVY